MSNKARKIKRIAETHIDPELKYVPLIHQIPDSKTSIFSETSDVVYSTNIDYPRAEYGFHHFIHATKNKTEILKQFEGKKKVYLVMNRFEGSVDNYEDTINNVSKKHFSLKGNIASRDFYKLWEILMLFECVNNKDKIVSVHLSDNLGAFCQSLICYREKFSKVSKNDKNYVITLDEEKLPKLDKEIEKYLKDKKVSVSKASIKKLSDEKLEKADLITANGSLDWINENVQEQELFKLLINQIYCAIKYQKKDGVFVCKFFETFTKTSIKLITILKQLYDKVYFIKPLISRLSTSEKFAVCIGFKDKDREKHIKSLGNIIKHESNLKIVDLFSTFKVPRNIIHAVINMNTNISNNQIKSINEIISFVKKEIYSGEEYHTKKEQQIEGSKYWINLYLETKDKNIYDNIVSSVVGEQNIKIDELIRKLVYVVS